MGQILLVNKDIDKHLKELTYQAVNLSLLDKRVGMNNKRGTPDVLIINGREYWSCQYAHHVVRHKVFFERQIDNSTFRLLGIKEKRIKRDLLKKKKKRTFVENKTEQERPDCIYYDKESVTKLVEKGQSVGLIDLANYEILDNVLKPRKIVHLNIKEKKQKKRVYFSERFLAEDVAKAMSSKKKKKIVVQENNSYYIEEQKCKI